MINSIKDEVMREYKKYEFCKAVDCSGLSYEHDKCILDYDCFKSAKTFHKWLNENGFKIVIVENK